MKVFNATQNLVCEKNAEFCVVLNDHFISQKALPQGWAFCVVAGDE